MAVPINVISSANEILLYMIASVWLVKYEGKSHVPPKGSFALVNFSQCGALHITMCAAGLWGWRTQLPVVRLGMRSLRLPRGAVYAQHECAYLGSHAPVWLIGR
jgi:hypothetical protein